MKKVTQNWIRLLETGGIGSLKTISYSNDRFPLSQENKSSNEKQGVLTCTFCTYQMSYLYVVIRNIIKRIRILKKKLH